MSFPNNADFALISVLTTAPSTFTKLCGIEGVTINRTVNTSENFKRDCDTPNRPGVRTLKATGSTWSISGSGVDNIDIEAVMSDATGVRKTYKVELYKDDGTDAGELMGTYSGTAMMTTRNQSYALDTPGSTEITLEGEGVLGWTVAP